MDKNVENQASLWLIEQKEGLSQNRQKEFEKWLEDEQNKKSYKELKNVEQKISFIDENLKAKLRTQLHKELEEELNQEEKTSFSIRPYLLVASFLIIAFVGFFSLSNNKEVLYTKTLQSNYKVQKNYILPDKTKVSLDAKTKIEIKFYDNKREITLLSGNVVFDVGKDKNRPLTIYTKKNTIQDIGTIFEVRLKDEISTVKVKEGIVKVGKIYNENKDSKILYILKEKDSVTLNKEGNITKIKKIPLEEIAIWQQNNIHFNETPLNKAINEFLNYTQQKVQLDKNIQNIQVTGNFKNDELERFINSLTLIYPIEFEKKDSIFYLKEKK